MTSDFLDMSASAKRTSASDGTAAGGASKRSGRHKATAAADQPVTKKAAPTRSDGKKDAVRDTRQAADPRDDDAHDSGENDEEEDDDEQEAEQDEEDEDWEEMHDDNGEDSEKQGEPDQEAGDDDTVDLYEYFSVAASASADEIKKSFRKMCLKFHPDKLTSLTSDADKAASTRKFQELSRYYAILSDPVRRKRYDETGYMGDSDRFVDVENFRPDGGWDSYFRNLWGKLTEDSIDKFTINYRGSSEELQDVLAAYKKNKGSMDAVLDSVPVSSWEDEARFREMILPIVEAGDAPRYVAFFKADPAATRRRQQRAEREAKEAEKQRNAPAKKKAGGKTKGKSEDDGLEALKAAISKRDPMADLIARLEKQEAAKASHSKRTAAKNKGKVEGRGVDAQADDEESTAAAGLPTDEEFAAIQAKMIAGSKGRSKGKDASITRKQPVVSAPAKNAKKRKASTPESESENSGSSDDYEDESSGEEIDELEDSNIPLSDEGASSGRGKRQRTE